MSDMSGVVAALGKLPPYVGLTWRGSTGELAVSLPIAGPLPTSRDLRVASANFTSPAAATGFQGSDYGGWEATVDPSELAEPHVELVETGVVPR